MTWPRIAGLRTLELGTPGEMRQRLTELVLAGRKRATAGRLAEYEAENEDVETVGERLVLVDDDGAARAIVAVDRVELLPFGAVTWEFAAAEAEGDESIDEWRTGHRRYFKAADGIDIGDDEPMVLIWLHLVPGPEFGGVTT